MSVVLMTVLHSYLFSNRSAYSICVVVVVVVVVFFLQPTDYQIS